jgi:tellurite resistance protein
MTDINEQRKKVEELKRKILEQKKKDNTGLQSSSRTDQIANEEKKLTEETKKHAEEVQRQIELASQQIEEETRRQEEEEKRKKGVPKAAQNGQAQPTVPVACLQAYAQALKFAWSDGVLSRDEKALLMIIQKSMGISAQEHTSLEQEAQLEIYLIGLMSCERNLISQLKNICG